MRAGAADRRDGEVDDHNVLTRNQKENSMNPKPRLKLTDIPEKVIALYAEILGIDTIEVIDRLVIKGDNVFLPLSEEEIDPEVPVRAAWVWSREDVEDDELEEALRDLCRG
jgi:hypothetical protein